MSIPQQYNPLPSVSTSLVQGRDAVQALLADAAGPPSPTDPVTASLAWVRRAVAAAPPTAVWGVCVRDGAAWGLAVLLDSRERAARDGEAGTRTDLLSGGGGYRSGVLTSPGVRGTEDFARTARELAGPLGAALADGADRRGTALELTGLPDTPAVRTFAAAAGAHVGAELPVPVVERPAPGAHLVSAGMRKNLRKNANRLATDGVTAELVLSRDPDVFAAALPEIEAAYRDRDAAHGLACPLDTPAGRRTWLDRLAALGEVDRRELATLRLDGELAAYVVGVPGEGRYGVFEGRFVTRWARYSPGRVLEHAVLQHAFADPGTQVVDWMTGIAPETLLTVSSFEPRVSLHRAVAGRTPRTLVSAQPASAR